MLALAQDFQRFDKRMDKLSKHLDQAHQDMSDVQISAKKITLQFQKMESVEIHQEDVKALEPQHEIVEHHT